MSGLVKKLIGFICLGAIVVGAILVVSDKDKRDYLNLQAPNEPTPTAPLPRVIAPPVLPVPPNSATAAYTPDDFPWLVSIGQADLLCNRIAVPGGFVRAPLEHGSFQDWLRHLPLAPGRPQVMLYNGRPKANQEVHEAVVDLDTGNTDLQQCADCVIRLRAEYLYSRGVTTDIHFANGAGQSISWPRWSAGERPTVRGRTMTWHRGHTADTSHKAFREYMKFVFQYAGTRSLAGELESVAERDVQPGDVFIHPGSPGHAVLVVDVASGPGGRKLMLLAQGFMPAQDMHVLRNLDQRVLSPWFDANFLDTLRTPEWTFNKGELKRFK